MTRMQSNAFRLACNRLSCKHPHCILNFTPRQPPCSPLDHPARTTFNGLDARRTPISRRCRSERLPTRVGDRCRAVRCRCHRRRCVVSDHAGQVDMIEMGADRIGFALIVFALDLDRRPRSDTGCWIGHPRRSRSSTPIFSPTVHPFTRLHRRLPIRFAITIRLQSKSQDPEDTSLPSRPLNSVTRPSASKSEEPSGVPA
jgi:hypothetical protein